MRAVHDWPQHVIWCHPSTMLAGFSNAVTSVSAVGARTQATLSFTAPSELCTADGKVSSQATHA